MLNTLLRDRTEDETELSVKGEISKNYALIDYAFLQKLDSSISEEKDPDKVARMTEVREAVNAEMASRMQLAAEAMKEIVQAPNPIVMEGKIVGLARKGRRYFSTFPDWPRNCVRVTLQFLLVDC